MNHTKLGKSIERLKLAAKAAMAGKEKTGTLADLMSSRVGK